MRTIIVIVIATVAMFTACRRAPVSQTEVASVAVSKLSLDPANSVWNDAPEHTAKLLLQDLVEPRLMKASTQDVRVRAVHSGPEIAFRLSWTDATLNDEPGPGRFLDGCGIQIPRKIEPNPPEPQMGQAGRAVEITFWRADWQASVNGRKDTIQALFPNATVDHYPFEAKSLEPGSAAQKEMATRFAPAAAVGNRRVGPREFPVEDMVAEGPGTLSPVKDGASRGKGVRTKDGWAVVMSRKLPEGLAAGTRTQIAFAVWEGSAQEAGSRKMRTGWIPLALREGK
ncbi:MAG: ethylbenzene dehydrogenase-related protein [Bryobacteraceae bacterium]|nr:ethylbenzene dehydrogenase-related protein [Bryobacteraceae bacterium]